MFAHDATAKTLILNHPALDAQWSWADSGRITCDRLIDRASGRSWVQPEPADPLFVLQIQGVGMQYHQFDVHREVIDGVVNVEATDVAADRGCTGARLRIDLTDLPMSVTWHVVAHPRHAVIRQWFTIANTGSEQRTITRAPIGVWNLVTSMAGITAHYGIERRQRFRKEEGADWQTWNMLPLGPGVTQTFETGWRKAATWLGLTGDDASGLFVGWEANVQAFCTVGDLHGTGDPGIDLWLEPQYRLAPGAAFTTPACFLGVAQGDLDEVSYRTHRFVEDVIAVPVDDDRFPYVAFNSWGYGAGIDDASMRSCFEICRKLGIELFVVDFGWEDADWHPRSDLFPDGLSPLADAAHEAGMQFGIHLSFGNVSSLSTMFREHPEWTNGLGQWAYLDEGTVWRVVLGNPAARDWMVDTLVRVIDETRIDWFLTDHWLWGPTRGDVQDLRATDDYLTIAQGLDVIIDRVRALRPHVLLEHCDNGIAFPTYRMTGQYVTSIGPDAVGSLYERVGAYRLSRVLPPRYLDSYVSERLAPQTAFDGEFGDYEYRSHMFGGPMILMTDIMAIEEGSDAWQALQRSIDLFKQNRRHIADGKVLHLLEPQPVEQVNGAWDGWDAIGSYLPERDSAIIMAFRIGGTLDERTIPLHGLNPATRYRVTFEDRSDAYESDGATLMRDGLLLSLPAPGTPRNVDGLGFVRASDVIYLNPVERTP